MDFSVRPERRVFHLDTECYIIYIGKDQDDYKPFLRVGNTASLAQNIKSLIYSIVVTDTLTGSPILERDNLSAIVGDEFRYIGDPGTVERFKQFLRHQEFPSDGYEETEDDILQDMGAYVYFYHDGNMRVTFDKTPIFNLRRREEEDRHYLQRAKTIKNHLLRNPLRYPAREFNKPGFFVLAGRTYFFNRGAVAAFDIPADYFADFAAAGIDPDRITTVYAPDVSEGLVRLFKRVRAKDARIHVVTDNPSNVKGIIDLFRVEKQLQLKSEVVKLQREKFTPVLDYRIKKTARHFVVESDSLPMALYVDSELGAVVRNVLSVSSAKCGWLYGGAAGSQRGALLEGVPHVFYSGVPPLNPGELQKYLPTKLYGLEDLMRQSETAALNSARSFFSDYHNDSGDLAGHVRKIRSVSRQNEISRVWWLFAQTARQLALAGAHVEQNERHRKQLVALADALAISADSAPQDEPPPSLVCDLYISADAVYPLYRYCEAVTPDRIRQASAAAQAVRIEEQPQDRVHFEREEKRLAELLASLDTEKARIRKARGEEEKQDAAAKAAADATVAGETAAARDRKRADERSEGRGSRWWLIAALLLLLLGAGLLFLLATDTGREFSRVVLGREAPAPVAVEELPAEPPADPDAPVPPVADDPALDPDEEPPDMALEAEPELAPDEPVREPGTAAPGVIDTGPPIDLAEWQDVEGLEARETAGGVIITVLDIIRLANRIALANGYRQMGAPPREGPNPLWIYPGNRLVMPDRREITVREGDNLWSLTADFIEEQLDEDHPRFSSAVAAHRRGEISTRRFVAELRDLQEFSNSENFSRNLSRTIQEVTGG
ncbi:MAG: hypothetical protein EA384_00175 [Spirochaetaceae bacterium]|nr:MAG: hypothetical protein EA384_00175 [Spirochaetaceae bacterium]